MKLMEKILKLDINYRQYKEKLRRVGKNERREDKERRKSKLWKTWSVEMEIDEI
jgi:hypothetical protein